MSIPGAASPLFLSAAAGAEAAAYQIDRSLRFNDDDSAHLSRNFSAEGNRKTWTWSGWLKQSGTTTQWLPLFEAYDGSSRATHDFLQITFYNNQIGVANDTVWFVRSQAVYRDYSAWMHVVVSFDTTETVADDRVKLYINGERVEDFIYATPPSLNTNYGANRAITHRIGKRYQNNYFDGYLADVHFIDGQALAPTDFGEYDSNNVWQPKEFAGSYSIDYSSHATNPSSFNGSAANLFDGDLTTGWQNTDTSGSTYASVDLTRGGATAGIAFTTSFEMYGAFSYNQVLEIDHAGGTHTYTGNPGGSGAWVDFASSLTSPVTAVRFKDSGGTGTPSWNAIRADGSILVDGGDNSFRLDFSDNSSDQALGYDAAVTQPTLNPRGGMDVITYTGNGSTQTIGGLAFQPDFVWIKKRGGSGIARVHALTDIVRGVGRTLESNSTSVDYSDPNALTAFNPDGFSIGSEDRVNENGGTYVAWCWKAGGPAELNEDGSIDSQVSVSTDYGFSVVSYTGTGSNATVGHGLSSAPKWVLYKSRGDANDWMVFHTSMGATKSMKLNSNGAEAVRSTTFNNTAPTDSVLHVGTNASTNNTNSAGMIAYCWSEVSGFSKFGSYSGTGSSGNSITGLGFKPRYLMIKRTDSSESWVIYDTARDDGTMTSQLYAESSGAESAGGEVAVNSDGFTVNATGTGLNASGGTYIYAAFADRPGNNWTTNNLIAEAGLETASQGMDVVLYTGNESTQKVGGPVYSATSDPSMTSAGQIFNGSLSTGGYYPGTGTDVVLTTSPFTINTQLRVYNNFRSDGTYAICLNGSCINVPGSGTNSANFRWSTVDLSSFTLPLDVTKLGYSLSQNSGNTIMAIEVDSTILIDGTGSPLAFQPDFVWIKPRTQVNEHVLVDVVRGAGYRLFSNQTNAENYQATSLTSFDSSGFSLGSHTSVNKSSINYVAWCWKAGGTASSNTDGSITSSVSANTTYGFSIVSYTGNGTSGATVGHGLGTVPSFIVQKDRDATTNWQIYHAGAQASGALQLKFTTAAAASNTSVWNNTAPSSSVITLGNGGTNTSGNDQIIYCWSEVPGFSKFGSYEGNGSSTGPTVTTGFRPRWIIIKRTDSADSWQILDTARGGYSLNDDHLFADLNAAEGATSSRAVDFLDDGFQPRGTNAGINASGGTYIYAAFASKPPGEIIDSLIDTPTNYEASSGNNGGNYATLNPLSKGSAITLANGNLDINAASSGSQRVWGTIGVSTGKWYFEFNQSSGTYAQAAGIKSSLDQNNSTQYAYHGNSGQKINASGTTSSYGATWTNGDVVGVAFDLDAKTITFFKNGVSQGQAFSSIPEATYFPYVVGWSGAAWGGSVNFGQRPFAYTPPTGFKSLCTTNLTDPLIEDGSTAMDVATWSGDSASSRLIPLGFNADFLWIKQRNATRSHQLTDTVRGLTKYVFSDLTLNELTSTNKVLSTSGSGFTVGNDGATNTSGNTYVAWAWDAGTTTATNTDGSITSNVRANQSAGFSIVTWSGTSANATIGHGLNAAPEFMILKRRDSSSTGMYVYHSAVSPAKTLYLYGTTAAETYAAAYNNTAPTSSVFSVGSAAATNSGNMLAYCFAPVAGYSAFGSYTGNGSSDGPFVYTGFRPAFILIKGSSFVSNWFIQDNERDGYNVNDGVALRPNLSNAEDGTTTYNLDILSNGFKLRTSAGDANTNSATFVWAAFASHPFKTARAR